MPVTIATQTTTTHVDQDKILVELAKLLFKASPLSIWGTFLGIAFVYLVLQPVVDHNNLLLWALAFAVMNTARLVHSIYRYRQNNLLDYKSWVREFSVIAFIASCFWGSASIFLFPVGEPIYQLMMAFVLLTTTAIAITNISMILSVIMPYILITLVPLIVRFVLADHETMPLSAIMVSLSMVLLMGGAYRSHKNIYETISLRIQEQNNAQKLRESKTRLSLHVQQTPLAVIEMDTDMIVTHWNHSAERIFGYTSSEAIGTHIANLIVPADDHTNIENFVNELTSQHNGTRSTHRNIKNNGTRILCEWFNTPLVDEHGIVIGLTALAQDITERSRIEHMKDNFISIVSHELRTPLTSLRGSLALVVGGIAGELPEKAHSLLSMADTNAQRLSLLIDDILDIQAIESGKLRFNITYSNIRELLKTAVTQNSGLANQSGIKVNFIDTNEDLHVHVDQKRIHQVVDNLISNAIKYSPKHESVDISLSHNKKTITVSICDKGPGVAEEFQEHLFDKFTQSEASSTRQFSGSGLGLSIAKEIIVQHGGRIYYKNAPSGGSCFFFELKCAQ